MKSINVVLCCTGSAYTIEYVKKAVKKIQIYSQRKVNVSVLADQLNYSKISKLKGVDNVFMVPGNPRTDKYLEPYWPKLSLFDPATIPFDSFYYFDTTSVFIASLEKLYVFCETEVQPFICLKDWWYNCYNTCFFRLNRGSKFDNVWNDYIHGRVFDNTVNFTDQDFVYRYSLTYHLEAKVTYPPKGLIESYKQSMLDRDLSAECSIVKFHGRPKPQDVVTCKNLIRYILSLVFTRYKYREGVWLYPLIARHWLLS